jgi:hypothetical protein
VTTDMSLRHVYPPTCRFGTPDGRCGDPDVRQYASGAYLCDQHSPWARAGQPEPLTPTEIAQRKEGKPRD